MQNKSYIDILYYLAFATITVGIGGTALAAILANEQNQHTGIDIDVTLMERGDLLRDFGTCLDIHKHVQPILKRAG